MRSLCLKTNFRVVDSNSPSLAGKLRKLYWFVENLVYCESDNGAIQGRQFWWPTTAFLFVMFGDMYSAYNQALPLCALRPLFC